MNRVKLELENCYGIKRLQKSFDFSTVPAYALYAPNGVMKSSLANTFNDVAKGRESSDRIFPDRVTVRKVLDENDNEIGGDSVLVVLPYDETFGITERTSTLLIDPKLRKEYEQVVGASVAAKKALLDALKKTSQSKRDMEAEITRAFTRGEGFDVALTRIEKELREQSDAPYSDVQYDTIFNDKVEAALESNDLKAAIEDYVRRYNELLAKSTYFKKGFDYYNAGQIAKSLADNGFFSAKHAVTFRADVGNRDITTLKELEAVITEDKNAILTDPALRKKFDGVSKQLEKNAELRKFCQYLQANEALVARMDKPELLRADILKSYLKTNVTLYDDWISKFNAAADRRKELEELARTTTTQWQEVIKTFNDRFVVPFTLEAKNQTQVMLGRTAIIDLGFTYEDGADTAKVEMKDLLKVLSMGERKALYVLNVIFEIQTRKKNNIETLVVVDDIADSFDYQNKYAIIQYLKDISAYGLFKLIVLTHNFDFFRTIHSRFIGYPQCLMASKSDAGITLSQATGIRNVFSKDWKVHFHTNPKKKIACIPFLRNLIEMQTGEDDPTYQRLTGMLHWKPGVTDTLTVGDLDSIFNAMCNQSGTSVNAGQLVIDLLAAQANACLGAGAAAGVNLENKIVLSIGIRMAAERFIAGKVADPAFVAAITDNQTQALVSKFKKSFPLELEAIKTLESVALMTPENIHINSFMYEPIVDMSDAHLRKLYERVLALT